MNMTQDEQKICYQFSTLDSCGYSRCCDCPYMINADTGLCKANCTDDEWSECVDERHEQGMMLRRFK